MAELRSLKRIYKNIVSISGFVNQMKDATGIEDVTVNLKMLQDEWSEYKDICDEVQESEKNLELQTKIEDGYFKVKRALLAAEQTRIPQPHENHNNVSMVDFLEHQKTFLEEISTIRRAGETEVRLPKVNIPTFSGRYSDFPSFKDLFESSVHNNSKIPHVHKLQYLKSLLKDDAAQLVKHFEITETNYAEAWEKIKTRYERKNQVVKQLIDKFIHQPRVKEGSSKQLSQLCDTCDDVIRGLKVLGQDAETRDPWMIHLLLEKLDEETKLAWAYFNKSDFPKFDELMTFLEKRSQAWETCTIPSNKGSSTNNKGRLQVKAMHSTVANTKVCLKCDKEHSVHECPEFKELTVDQRRGFIAEKRCCFNCLSQTHFSTVCRSKFRCSLCKARHHTLLHQAKPNNQEATSKPKEEQSSTSVVLTQSPRDIRTNMSVSERSTFRALLPTAVVTICDNFGKSIECRILLDSGSQASFITESCAQRLQLRRRNANILVRGISNSGLQTKGTMEVKLQSRVHPQEALKIEAFILNKLPRLPSADLYVDEEVTSTIQLADPGYNQTSDIDILIGADAFFLILREGQIQNISGIGNLLAQNTMFGWVISGGSSTNTENIYGLATTFKVDLETNIDETLRRFWELDEPRKEQHYTPDETACEKDFASTVSRDDFGRYTVQLPFKENTPKLGNSYNAALRRFYTLEKRLNLNPKLKAEYKRFMEEYVQQGHMKRIDAKEVYLREEECYYLPHHAVIREDKETTKIRVVFDGSAKSSSGVSLNEKLRVGPTIQATLWDILTRFRIYKFVMTADIEKMFRQVNMAENHQNYQRILWRSSPNQEVVIYKLRTVTYGTASAPFLAIRTLHQLASDIQHIYPLASPAIKTEFYVDDFLSGADHVDEIQDLKLEMIKAMKEGGFHLRKWKSNLPKLSESAADKTISMGDSCTTKVLGLQWNPLMDAFSFKVNLIAESVPTKRKMLSESSKIFDPLGFLSPVTIILKIIFQRLWLEKLDWDDTLPDETAKRWAEVRSELNALEEIKIPRRVKYDTKVELHGFSDASERAYAAVVYLRSTDENGQVHTNIVAAKTKVAPLKQITLPRLELCAAVLLAKLLKNVMAVINNESKVYAWSDSQIVLAWLSDYPSRWKTFVANRVSEILESVPSASWNYVPSEQNPADPASRGLQPTALGNSKLWWEGPIWLRQSKEKWPISSKLEVELRQEQRKTYPLANCNALIEMGLTEQRISEISSFSKLRRVLAYVFRFIHNARTNHSLKKSGVLSVQELRDATNACFKYVQGQEFKPELNHLRKYGCVPRGSKLESLSPFIDSDGVLRVGGRLERANVAYNQMHQVILPKSHKLGKLIISHVHDRNFHCGPSLTSHLVKQQYWIINSRNMVRHILRNCVMCARMRAKTSQQIMANLPAERINPSRPFSRCGVDYAGPITIVSKRGRGAKPIKAYIAVFVCMVTKAGHLELVGDLTTEAFIAALRRFSARRGVPAHIFSDNGTNFQGARRKLDEMTKILAANDFENAIQEYLSNVGIQWHNIPPAAPHFGGLWEAMVKSVKTRLLIATKNAHLTFEEMATLLCQIEAILNSRPLYPIGEDESSIDALTPGHFLIGATPYSIPDEELLEVPDNRLSRWQNIQKRLQGFWKRYQLEYFCHLQQRHKWKSQEKNLKTGDIVLIKDQNLSPCKWPLGRIVEVHRGDDGNTRAATIKTANSILKRPIIKLCSLPTNKED